MAAILYNKIPGLNVHVKNENVKPLKVIAVISGGNCSAEEILQLYTS